MEGVWKSQYPDSFLDNDLETDFGEAIADVLRDNTTLVSLDLTSETFHFHFYLRMSFGAECVTVYFFDVQQTILVGMEERRWPQF